MVGRWRVKQTYLKEPVIAHSRPETSTKHTLMGQLQRYIMYGKPKAWVLGHSNTKELMRKRRRQP